MRKKQYEITWNDGITTEAEFKDSKTMRKDGWKVVRIWEHQIKNDMKKSLQNV